LKVSEVKTFLIEGKMLISHDKNPRWQKFAIYRRGTKESDVIERVLSELGSRHKLKRYHIRIENIREVTDDEIEDLATLQLLHLKEWIAFDEERIWRKYKLGWKQA